MRTTQLLDKLGHSVEGIGRAAIGEHAHICDGDGAPLPRRTVFEDDEQGTFQDAWRIERERLGNLVGLIVTVSEHGQGVVLVTLSLVYLHQGSNSLMPIETRRTCKTWASRFQ